MEKFHPGSDYPSAGVKKLDIYIIKKYLGSFFFTCLLFTLISLVIDFSEKTEKFVNASKSATILEILRDYHLNYIPFINGLLWPLFSLISVIFFTSRMAYNSEIISILNAGVSFKRLLRPYFISGGMLTVFHLVGNHFIIPYANGPKLEFERRFINRESDRKVSGSNIHFFLSPDTKIYLRNYSSTDTLGYNFRLERFEGNTLVYLLKAQSLFWNKDSTQRWRVRDYEIRTYIDSVEHVEVHAGQELDTLLPMFPSDFEFYAKQKDLMTTPALQATIDKEKRRGLKPIKAFVNEINRRTADPFTILILTVIGVAISARKVRGGMGLHLAIGIFIGAIFIFISKFSIVFSQNPNIPSLLGIWLPNIVFGSIAYFLAKRAQQ
jgi:lipopolysaccharide export system permease protein